MPRDKPRPPAARKVEPLVSKRILCRLGLHAWRMTGRGLVVFEIECKRCGRLDYAG